MLNIISRNAIIPLPFRPPSKKMIEQKVFLNNMPIYPLKFAEKVRRLAEEDRKHKVRHLSKVGFIKTNIGRVLAFQGTNTRAQCDIK